MVNHKEIVQKRDDISWKDVMEAVDEKKRYLESANRYYKGDYPITSTVVVQQESDPVKLIVLDEIKYDKDKYQYRFGYWVVSDKKLKNGTISVAFGQFASIIPPKDFQKLIEKAEQTEWEGPAPW